MQVELETALNKLRATQQMEHLRATDLAQKTVEAEAAVKKVHLVCTLHMSWCIVQGC